MGAPTKIRIRNPRGEGRRLRDEIVGAATRLIDAQGAAAVTLRAVAREAGIAAPSIYGHFDDRDQIVDAVIQACFAELTADIVAARDAADDPVERLHAGCDAYLRFAERVPQRYALLFHRPDLRDATPYGAPDDNGAVAFGTLVDGIAGCAAAGRSRSTEPFNDAAALWAALHGYATLRATQTAFPWPDHEDTLARMIDGLAHIIRSPTH